MTRLDDLLRLAADTPAPPAGFTAAILRRVEDVQERRGLRRLFSFTLLVSVTAFLSIHLFSLTTLEFIGGKWRELLGGFYEEPALFLSREGLMALLEHLMRGNIPLLLGAVVLFLFTLRGFLHAYSSLPSRSHGLH